MPIHDWSRVDVGIFHGFHLAWIAEIRKALNNGGLPPGYYADAEQYSEKKQADVLTLHASDAESLEPLLVQEPSDGGTAVMVASSIGTRTARRDAKPKARQRRLVIRHISGHRVIAILEIVSTGNKDRRRSAMEFAGKLANAIEGGIHVTVIDLFPPTPAAPNGLHNRIWREFDREPVPVPAGQPLVLAAFVARQKPRIFFEFRAVGGELQKFPLPIDAEIGAMMPLAETYAAAFAGSPPYLRDMLSQAVPGV